MRYSITPASKPAPSVEMVPGVSFIPQQRTQLTFAKLVEDEERPRRASPQRLRNLA
jgi:hypothetical protein